MAHWAHNGALVSEVGYWVGGGPRFALKSSPVSPGNTVTIYLASSSVTRWAKYFLAFENEGPTRGRFANFVVPQEAVLELSPREGLKTEERGSCPEANFIR